MVGNLLTGAALLWAIFQTVESIRYRRQRDAAVDQREGAQDEAQRARDELQREREERERALSRPVLAVSRNGSASSSGHIEVRLLVENKSALSAATGVRAGLLLNGEQIEGSPHSPAGRALGPGEREPWIVHVSGSDADDAREQFARGEGPVLWAICEDQLGQAHRVGPPPVG